MNPAQTHIRPRRDAYPTERRRRAIVARDPARRPVRIRLWLPLTPLWMLLAPFALLLAPLLALAPETRGIPPYRAAFAIGATLIAMSGTVVDVDAPGAVIKIRIL
jgi:hypothetical protein